MSAKKILIVLVGVMLGTASISSGAATQAQIDTARNKGLWWLFVHHNGEGRWGNSSIAAVASTASALEALSVAGLRGPIYSRGYSWLANAPSSSVDSLARQITAVNMGGGNTTRLTNDLMSARNTLLGWGSYARYDTSFPDTALALISLLPSTTYTTADAQQAVCRIMEAVRADGGWSYSKAGFPGTANSSIVPTAYNMLALKAAQDARGLTACSGVSITSRLNSSMSWLLTKKKTDSGFSTGSASSVIETAFAYRVLKQWNPADPSVVPALDYLLAQQSAADGSWSSNDFLTAMVTSLLPAPATPLADADGDGAPDAVELLVGTNPNVIDSRWIAPGNGQGKAGITIPMVLASDAILGQPFSFTLSAPIGGTPPYAWSVPSGNLPTGITLSSGGVFSGTPTVLGSYSFYYSAIDAASAQATTIGQINVYKSAPSLADGDLNGDGVVDVADVVLAERIALGLLVPTQTQLQHADVSPVWYPDGVIDAADVAWIRRKALGLESW